MPQIPLNRDRAWACVSRNISLPGWGSLKAGKKWTGIGEIVLAVVGFLLMVWWMGEWFVRLFQSELGESLRPVPSPWFWRSGAICMAVSWVWTAVTCVSLVREGESYEKSVPPRLSDLPKPPKL
ncbi:MAG: hypothetical protein ACRED1_15535 [Limisphaerales bacterium]